MKRYMFVLSIILFLLQAFPALAAQRTFVSTSGADTNSCTLASPCRTIQGALANTNAKGEVVILKSGAYGTFKIKKAVSIIAPSGVFAGIDATTGNAISVSVGTSDTVVLQGLTIKGNGGTNGIDFVEGGNLYVRDCSISGFAGNGIQASNGNLFVIDTTLKTNVAGLSAAGTSDITIENCIITNNGTGVSASSSATIRISNATVVYNTTGLSQADSSSLNSWGNNKVGGNTTDTNGIITSIPQM